jgi:hypothetical protein
MYCWKKSKKSKFWFRSHKNFSIKFDNNPQSSKKSLKLNYSFSVENLVFPQNRTITFEME